MKKAENTYTLIKVPKILNRKIKTYCSILSLDKEKAQSEALELWLQKYQKAAGEEAKEIL